MAALWLIAKPFLPYLIGALLLGGAFAAYKARVAYAHHEGVSEGRKEQHDADVATAEAEQKRAEALWLASLNKAADAARADKDKRDAEFAKLSSRAAAVRGSVCIPRALDGLLRDVTRDANHTGPAAGGASDPAALSDAALTYDGTEFAEFQVKAGAAYADAVGQHKACLASYDALRKKGGTQ